MGKNKKTDNELAALLTNLYTMQEDLGAKPKTTDEERKSKAETATMGRGNKAEKKGSRFLELKSLIVEKLQIIHRNMQEISSSKGSVAANKNPKEVIVLQNQIREQIREISEEYAEMNNIYRKEARKRKSKFTPEELEIQATLVERLGEEIDNIKEVQMRGFGGGGTKANVAALNTNLQGLEDSPLHRNIDMPDGDVALSDSQTQHLAQIDARDKDFDNQLDMIGQGIQDLQDIADSQNEEVKIQNTMLNALGEKIDNVEEHQMNVNQGMKELLEANSRGPDKLCVDIMCIVFAIGFVAVFINMAKKYSE